MRTNSSSLVVRLRAACSLLAALTLLSPGAPIRAADPLIRSGQKITFLGDAVMAHSAGKASGFEELVVSGLKANGIEVTATTSANGKDTSATLLARIDQVLGPKPDWIILNCGLNDQRPVDHGGLDVAAYEQNIKALLAKAETAGVKVMIVTASPLTEKLDSDQNQKRLPYNEVLRAAAVEKKLPLADVYAAFDEALGHVLKRGVNFTVENFFMNPHGDELVAVTILQAAGLTPAQLDTARKAWDAIPLRYAVTLRSAGGSKGKELALELDLTKEDFDHLLDVTNQRSSPVEISRLLAPYYKEEVQALLAPAGPYATTAEIISTGKEAEVRKILEGRMRERIQGIYAGNVIKGN